MEGLGVSGLSIDSAKTGGVGAEVGPVSQDAQELIDVSGENIAAMPTPEMRMMPPSTESGKAVFTENGANKTALDVDSDGQADTVLTEFKDGSSAVMQDSNFDGKADLMKMWNANGEVTMSANDQNFDGNIDRMYTAEDTNHDNKLDTGTLSLDENYDGIMDKVGTGEAFLETGAPEKSGFVDVSGEKIEAMAAPDMRQMPEGSGPVSVSKEDGAIKIAIDGDGDKQAEKVFTIFKDGSKAIMNDQNNDGKADAMKKWNANGELEMAAMDKNGDGKLDLMYTAEDTNHDNKLDTAKLSLDDDFDGIMDKIGTGEEFLQKDPSKLGTPEHCGKPAYPFGKPITTGKPTPAATPVINEKPAPVGDVLLETVDASTVDAPTVDAPTVDAPTVDASTNSQPTK